MSFRNHIEKNIKHSVVYDGDCGFCQSSVDLIKKLDWLNKFEFIPFQREGVFKKYKKLTKDMCEKEIYLVENKVNDLKNYYAGYDAFKKMSVYIPLTFIMSWFFFLPVVSHIGRRVYKVIAANRHKIRLGNKACKID